MRELARRALVAGKRMARPWIPDSVVLWMRTSPTSDSQARSNIDLVIDDPKDRMRWLRGTPDVYRVRDSSSFGHAAPQASVATAVETADTGGEVVALATRALPVDEKALLAPLADPQIQVSFIAATTAPPVNRTSVAEPKIDPIAVAIRRGALDEVGGFPPGAHPLPGLLDRCRNAGHAIAVTPVAPTTDPERRNDPAGGLGSVVILAVVPVHDVGGGSRGAQMAQELAARGYHVTYVSVFPVDETVDLGVRYIHPMLEQRTIDDWDTAELLPRIASGDRLAIVQLPHWKLLPHIAKLKQAGFRVVYDLIDDWSDPALGSWGFDPTTQEKVIALSDGLVASAPALVRELESLSGRTCVEVGNGVNTRLFVPAGFQPQHDIPPGDGPLIEYHGSLYGNWFDWDALERVANEVAAARLIVIGDEKDHPPMPDNVHFLGLKPQNELPPYVAESRVGIVPFVVSGTTHAVSPLKVFEYLAMGVPVAAPPLESLAGIEGVHTDPDLVVAVRQALASRRPDPALARAIHGWGPRLESLFDSVGLVLGEDPSAPPVTYRRRPAIRWEASERLVVEAASSTRGRRPGRGTPPSPPS